MRRSLLAGVNALFRARESRRPPHARVLADPWADLLAERDPRVQAIRAARWVLPPLRRMIDELQTVHCVRHRAIDALVLAAVAEGFRQVVVVGCGYDMRPSRFRAELGDVRWIEVDHPATAARKWRLLEGRADVAGVERATVDLLAAPLRAALARTGFDPAAPACFVVEGLVHYLTPRRFEALLADVAAGPGRRRLILSYIRSDMYARASRLFVWLVQAMREVPALHFAPGELEAMCARHGLGRFRSWDLAAQVEEFAPEARGRPMRLSQDVAAVSS